MTEPPLLEDAAAGARSPGAAPSRVLIATRSAGKLREIRHMTAAGGLRWLSLDEVEADPAYTGLRPIPEAVEDGATFAENARIKALHYARLANLHTLADDSGLVVDALHGEPGVRSARYAGEPRDDARNNARLIAALADVSPDRRTARFICHMAFAKPGRVLIESAGRVEGRIVEVPRGGNGFGYDPHFEIPAVGRTAAELSPEEKSALSHRGAALRDILPRIEALLSDRTPRAATGM